VSRAQLPLLMHHDGTHRGAPVLAYHPLAVCPSSTSPHRAALGQGRRQKCSHNDDERGGNLRWVSRWQPLDFPRTHSAEIDCPMRRRLTNSPKEPHKSSKLHTALEIGRSFWVCCVLRTVPTSQKPTDYRPANFTPRNRPRLAQKKNKGCKSMLSWLHLRHINASTDQQLGRRRSRVPMFSSTTIVMGRHSRDRQPLVIALVPIPSNPKPGEAVGPTVRME
jgi:hypothetical protein